MIEYDIHTGPSGGKVEVLCGTILYHCSGKDEGAMAIWFAEEVQSRAGQGRITWKQLVGTAICTRHVQTDDSPRVCRVDKLH